MDRTQKSGRGCLFYGLITIVAVIIALFVGTYFGTRKALNMVMQNYTGTAPVEIPQLELTPEEREARVEALDAEMRKAVESGGTVAFGDVDLNLLLARTPGVSNFADQIFLRVETNRVKADVSIPLDQFEDWKKVARRFQSKDLSGRYLNATLSLVPAVVNGALQLDLEEIEVKGEALPDTFTGKVDLETVTEQANRSPEAKKVLDRIEAVEVTEGEVRITLKPEPTESGGTP